MLNLQLATSYDNYMISIPVYPHILADPSQPVTADEFKQGWVSGQQMQADQPMIPQILNNEESLKSLFRQNGIVHLSTQLTGGARKYYFGCRLDTREVALVEITAPSPTMIGGYQVVVKSASLGLVKAFGSSVVSILR